MPTLGNWRCDVCPKIIAAKCLPSTPIGRANPEYVGRISRRRNPTSAASGRARGGASAPWTDMRLRDMGFRRGMSDYATLIRPTFCQVRNIT